MNGNLNKKPLIILAVTVTQSVSFFKGQITYLRNNGYEVGILSSPGDIELEGATFYPISMQREISPLKDLQSLWRIYKLLRRLKPEIINAGTPKAGLLCGIAAFASRVPVRIYMSHGLRLETLRGFKRKILIMTEKISSFCANQVICVSHSLRQKMIEQKLTSADKSLVIHHGSCNGINLEDFNKSMNVDLEQHVERIRAKLNIPQDRQVLGFVGRFTKDKGIKELIEAFEILTQENFNIHLLLCGDFEEGDPVEQNVIDRMKCNPHITMAGFVSHVIPYYYLMDLFVLPSFREGYPTVLLEASAAGLPVVSTYVTGCIDAVMHGVNGFLVKPGNSYELAEGIRKLLQDPELAKQMGSAGRKRVEMDFKSEDIWKGYLELYQSMGHGHVMNGLNLKQGES